MWYPRYLLPVLERESSGKSVAVCTGERPCAGYKGIRKSHSFFVAGTGKSIPSPRHRDLKPGAFARCAILGDCDTGYGENFTGKEQSEPGVLAESLGEEPLFVLCGDPYTTILADNREICI